MRKATENAATSRSNREGFALVTTLLVVLVLSVLAVGAAWLAGSEKKTTFAEGVHVRSTFSADAGSEAAINFIRVSNLPPRITDFSDMGVRSQNETALQGSQTYEYDCNFLPPPTPKAGWGMEYKDFDYQVASQGRASTEGRTDVAVMVSRLFKTGY